MSDYLFDLCIALILLVSFGLWLVNRKPVKWLIKQWLRVHYGYHFVKKHRHHYPWVFLPVALWWLTGDLPAWVLLVRFVVVSSLATFYKLYRKRQKAAIPKQRGIVYIPPQKEKDNETRPRPSDQTREQETSECAEPAPSGEEAPPPDMETPGTEERSSPQSIFAAHRVRRVRKDELC